MRYLIAVFRDRIRAEEAYFKLESMNFAMGNVTILGKGYQSVDEYGLRDPQEEAWGRVKRMATWLVPFGFVAGVIFDTITGLQTFAWTGTLGNQILGGLLGAGSGAMGSFFVGGGPTLIFRDSERLTYREQLEAGTFLLVIKGPEDVLTQGGRIIQSLRPEALEAQ